MKCKLQMKTNIEFGLTEMCFPSLGLGHKYKLKMSLKPQNRIILAASLLLLPKIEGAQAPPIDPTLLKYIGWSHDNLFDN